MKIKELILKVLININFLRADHPSNKKRGDVCTYYKEHRPIIKRDEYKQ